MLGVQPPDTQHLQMSCLRRPVDASIDRRALFNHGLSPVNPRGWQTQPFRKVEETKTHSIINRNLQGDTHGACSGPRRQAAHAHVIVPDLFNRMLQAAERKVHVRYRLVSNRKDADASAAKRGTSATIIIYRTEPQLGYFTSVASIEQPKVYLKSIGGLSCEVNE